MRAGDRVQVTGSVADERGQVPRGLRGRVIGDDPTHTDDRGPCVVIRTEDGQVFDIPQKALKVQR